MVIWNKLISLDLLNSLLPGTICEQVGLEITEIGDDYLKGTLPVDHRTQQYMGILHGGASVVLAETLGSAAANFCAKPGFHIVGLDINANHVRAGKPPLVTGVARPVHIGSKTIIVEINIHDAEDNLVCVSRLTAAVLEDREKQ